MLRRKWRKPISLTFLLIFVTLLYILIGNGYFPDSQYSTGAKVKRRGGLPLEIIVGHYSGPLSESRSKLNFTDEELNSNYFNPLSSVGDDGKPVNLVGTDKNLADRLFQINQFNVIASDRMALDRTLPDVRRKACLEKSYPLALPKTSVIIVFHNEAWSTLIRTVTSVINRSPKRLLKEIILVDDFSTRRFLKNTLEQYVALLPVSVIILRARQRIGLIQARLMGAQNSTAEVITFLDSHCECTDGWLEPLLTRIAEERTVVVCPVIDVINDKTFQFQKGIDVYRGGFNWNLQFRWYSPPASELKRRGKDATAPIRTPTMAGGLYAIERTYFFNMGSYDERMKIWGGENLEMSFRIWQCGGSLEILPCSHVGHVFRKKSPHDFPTGSSSKTLSENLVRLAEVWMDDWKGLFYLTSPAARNFSKKIDVSDRVALRQQLKCKDFSWYLKNVWPEHFMPTDGDFFGRIRHDVYKKCLQLVFVKSSLGRGNEKRVSAEPCNDNYQQVRNVASNYCLVNRPVTQRNSGRKSELLYNPCTKGYDLWQVGDQSYCTGEIEKWHMNTIFWVFKMEGFIKADENQCLGAVNMKNGQWIVQLRECSHSYSEQWWYDKSQSLLVHNESSLCLGSPTNTEDPTTVHLPVLQKCSRRAVEQSWLLEKVDWKMGMHEFS